MGDHRHIDRLVYGIAILANLGKMTISPAEVGVISHYVLRIVKDKPDLVSLLLEEAEGFAPMGDSMLEAVQMLTENVEEGKE